MTKKIQNPNEQNFKKVLPRVQKNVLLKNYTTLKIGGPAKYFFEAKTKEDLIEALKVARQKKLPFFILGGGSNLFVADRGFDGLVINFQFSIFSIEPGSRAIGNFQKDKITAGAGTKLEELVKASARAELTGLEWAAGIPGTLGGAVYGNVGAFGGSMADVIEEVECADRTLSNKDCQFSCKNSVFKKNKNLIILSCVLGLKRGDKKEIKKKIKYFLDYREKNHPLNFPSAGSIFKNPSKMPAGELIEKCGLKGKRIGKAQVSQKHANFIVNIGKASSSDVLKLINLIKKEVKRKFGIELKEEIQFLGF